MKAEKQHKVLQSGLIQPKRDGSKLGFVDNRFQTAYQFKLVNDIQNEIRYIMQQKQEVQSITPLKREAVKKNYISGLLKPELKKQYIQMYRPESNHLGKLFQIQLYSGIWTVGRLEEIYTGYVRGYKFSFGTGGVFETGDENRIRPTWAEMRPLDRFNEKSLEGASSESESESDSDGSGLYTPTSTPFRTPFNDSQRRQIINQTAVRSPGGRYYCPGCLRLIADSEANDINREYKSKSGKSHTTTMSQIDHFPPLSRLVKKWQAEGKTNVEIRELQRDVNFLRALCYECNQSHRFERLRTLPFDSLDWSKNQDRDPDPDGDGSGVLA